MTTTTSPTIPDAIATRIAIEAAERSGQDPRDDQCVAEGMIAYSVTSGGGLAEARYWALEAALHRDRRQTITEREATAA